MCWSESASVGMVGLGAGAAAVAAYRGQPPAIYLTLLYFTLMEALQAAGYRVVDDCGSSANQSITLLSYLHIAFQPFFINAFAMELVPVAVKKRLKRGVYGLCGLSAASMLLQLAPLDFAGSCRPGSPLCAESLCLVSGNWHIAWNIPYNGLFVPLESWVGVQGGFPTYMLTVFLMPLAYGAWRFVIFHALAGPILAQLLTNNPNEFPAVWCLFSIGILLIGLSPLIRSKFEIHSWKTWPKAWQE